MNRDLIFTSLVNIEAEGPLWLDWAAALYESYAADHEALDVAELHQCWQAPREAVVSADRYAKAATAAAEEAEYAVYAILEDRS